MKKSITVKFSAESLKAYVKTFPSRNPAACRCPFQPLKINAFRRAYDSAIAGGAFGYEAVTAAVAAAKEAAAGCWSCQDCARRGCGCSGMAH